MAWCAWSPRRLCTHELLPELGEEVRSFLLLGAEASGVFISKLSALGFHLECQLALSIACFVWKLTELAGGESKMFIGLLPATVLISVPCSYRIGKASEEMSPCSALSSALCTGLKSLETKHCAF